MIIKAIKRVATLPRKNIKVIHKMETRLNCARISNTVITFLPIYCWKKF